MSDDFGVLFVSSVAGLEGGAERSLVELALALQSDGARPSLAVWSDGALAAAFRAAGLEVFVMRARSFDPASPLGGRTRNVPGVASVVARLARLRVSLMPLRAERAWLQRVVARTAPRVIHTNCDVSPLVVTRIERPAACWVAHVRDSVRFWAHPRVARALRCADAVVAPSRHLADWLQAIGIRASVVPNPVEGRLLARPIDAEERDRLRTRLDVPPASLGVAILGRLDAQKGAHMLPEIVRAVPQATFLLAGRSAPGMQAELEHALRAAGVADRVRFLGFRHDVQQWLPALDVLVMPSTGEGFGRVVVEGMLAGLPVVAADDAGARELIRHGETGILAAAGDPAAFASAVAALCDDPASRRGIGDAARAEGLARFHPKGVARMVRDIYEAAGC